jgi:hypothetical protein
MMERFAEFVGAAIGLTVAFVWVFWRMRALTVPAFVIGLALGLSSCNSVRKLATSQDAGFSQGGGHHRPARVVKRAGNVEVWSDR